MHIYHSIKKIPGLATLKKGKTFATQISPFIYFYLFRNVHYRNRSDRQTDRQTAIEIECKYKNCGSVAWVCAQESFL